MYFIGKGKSNHEHDDRERAEKLRERSKEGREEKEGEREKKSER